MPEINDKQLDKLAEPYIMRRKLHHHTVMQGVAIMARYHRNAGRTLAAETKRERLNGMEHMLTELVHHFEFNQFGGDGEIDLLRTYASAIIDRLLEFEIKNRQDED